MVAQGKVKDEYRSHLRRRATSFSARSRCVLSGAQQPTAFIDSLQLRVLQALCPRLLRLILPPAAPKRRQKTHPAPLPLLGHPAALLGPLQVCMILRPAAYRAPRLPAAARAASTLTTHDYRSAEAVRGIRWGAEKAQKAEADAALRAAIANTTAGRGVSDRSSLRPPWPFRCAKAPASAFSACPLATRSATGPRSRSRCGCIVSPVRALPGALATCQDSHRSAI